MIISKLIWKSVNHALENGVCVSPGNSFWEQARCTIPMNQLRMNLFLNMLIRSLMINIFRTSDWKMKSVLEEKIVTVLRNLQ